MEGTDTSRKTAHFYEAKAEICLGLQSIIETIKILFHASATMK